MSYWLHFRVLTHSIRVICFILYILNCGIKPQLLTHRIPVILSLQNCAAVRPRSGITGSWRILSINKGKDLASVTSQWVCCPRVATRGTVIKQTPVPTRSTVWKHYVCVVENISALCVWGEAFVLIPGLLGEQSCPVLSCDLLSGDYHMLKPSTLWLPSASSDLQSSIIPLFEGVFFKLDLWSELATQRLCKVWRLLSCGLTGDWAGATCWSEPALCCCQTPQPSAWEGSGDLGLDQRLAAVGRNQSKWGPFAFLPTGWQHHIKTLLASSVAFGLNAQDSFRWLEVR